MSFEIFLSSMEDTKRFARDLASLLERGDVIGLNGSLGAGKTTLVAQICKNMGLMEGYVVTSPTFVFAHEYPCRIPVHHLDLYRIESKEELGKLGLDEILGGDGVCMIEWIDRFSDVWKDEALYLTMTVQSEKERKLEVRGVGTRGIYLEQKLKGESR